MATEKIGTLSNRVFSNLLDRSFKNGSISAKEYRDLRKKYFGKPKLIQMDLFPDDPKKKQKGGLMEQTNGLKKMGLKEGGPADKSKKLKDKLLEKRFQDDLKKFKKEKKFKDLTPQQKKELLDKIKKREGKLTNPYLFFNKLGQPYMEAKDGGLAAATAKLKAQGLKKGGFPDLSGDGKVTMKDVLMGRGVIKKPKKKQRGGSMDNRSAFLKARARKPSGRLNVDDIKRAKGTVKSIARGLAKAAVGPIAAIGKAGKKAGRLAKRGYGIARK